MVSVLTIPIECPNCGVALGEGARHFHETREEIAESMYEAVDVTTTETIRCLACFSLIDKHVERRREGISY